MRCLTNKLLSLSDCHLISFDSNCPRYLYRIPVLAGSFWTNCQCLPILKTARTPGIQDSRTPGLQVCRGRKQHKDSINMGQLIFMCVVISRHVFDLRCLFQSLGKDYNKSSYGLAELFMFEVPWLNNFRNHNPHINPYTSNSNCLKHLSIV